MATAGDFTERVFYPESDDMGEHELQTYIRELLRPLLARFFAVRGELAHVGSDQFFYWVKGDAQQQLAPDVYVLPGVSQAMAIPSWKVWERGGVVPSFALEIVSSNDWEKDYVENLPKYAALGVRELVLFDPEAYLGEAPRTAARIAFTRFERVGDRLERTARTKADRLYSPLLGVWFRAIGEGSELRVRLALGPDGDQLFPTEAEAERAERQAAERAAEEAARAADVERAERQAAERAAEEAARAAEVAREAERAAAARVAELEQRLAELERRPRS
jgi:Uma2 family endonuclease